MRNIFFILISVIVLIAMITLTPLGKTLINENRHHSMKQISVQKKAAKLKPKNKLNTSVKLPKTDHIVIVIEENHGYSDIIGNTKQAPFINHLTKEGATFTSAHGVTHPSQPNYIALFSGSTHGVTSDHCPQTLHGDNLASLLISKNLTFKGYSEDLPSTGYTGCRHLAYFRKHNPWSDFTNVPKDLSLPFGQFPKQFSKLPTVSFVIPNQNHDMHDGTITEADQWLRRNMEDYINWAKKHNSLFILTWDEDDFTKSNHIPLIVIGDHVKKITYTNKINHFNILSTIEAMYHLPYLDKTDRATPLTEIWK